jgi:hypothetical protein
MKTTDDYDALDDAADTLRFSRADFAAFDDDPTDPDATAIWEIATPVLTIPRASARRRRQIRDTRENIRRLREALAAGWDIAPELAFEQRQLIALEAADRVTP